MHPLRVSLADARQRRARQNWMQRRNLELVTDWTVQGKRVEKMVRVDRLRCPGKTVDALGHERGGYDGGMQKGAFADRAVRIGQLAA